MQVKIKVMETTWRCCYFDDDYDDDDNGDDKGDYYYDNDYAMRTMTTKTKMMMIKNSDDADPSSCTWTTCWPRSLLMCSDWPDENDALQTD